jgi:hypothetical protein
MTDVMSVLASSYQSTSLATPSKSKSKYVAVDPKLYQGTWTGKYANNKSFTIYISEISGFHAKVRYQSGDTVKFQEVLIKDSAFRVGDTKFTLTGSGKALIKNVVTDPVTGSTYLDTAYAALQN